MKRLSTLALAASLAAGCAPSPTPETAAVQTPAQVATETGTAPLAKRAGLAHPDWSRDAVIYEINVRQYSEAGTFEAVRADLPRIRDLGVDILWLMPIHPIGEARRKGPMGSPYAVRDYFGVNPEFGTEDDFRRLVEDAQAMGFKVILDWVANHSAWDNPMIFENPHWYTNGEDGEIIHPEGTDWEDVADFNYDDPDMRQYMSDALVYWVEEFGIDGYRCDVAGMVPTDFWNDVRPRLEAVKPVFMLAEWQEPELHEQAFNASYAWRWKEILQDVMKGEAVASDLGKFYDEYQSADWPTGAMRMTYTSNHDQNTWDGLPQEIYGDAYEAAMVVQFAGDGIPMIYSGQECLNPNRLEFFEKDEIVWNCDTPDGARINRLFKDLVQLKTDNAVLHNGDWGAPATILQTDKPEQVFSFVRQNAAGNAVLVTANFSNTPQTFSFTDGAPQGDYSDFRTGEAMTFDEEPQTLPAWGWTVHVRD
ncbi:MAG: alpha-amylase family glycosyl hydrolase [Litorimonas sp.]